MGAARQVSTPHAKLRTEITDWLKSIGAWYVCTNSQGYGRKGIPDILCCAGGKFIAIEVKVGRDKASAWQTRELNAITAAGGGAGVFRSLAEVQAVFGDFVEAVAIAKAHKNNLMTVIAATVGPTDLSGSHHAAHWHGED